MASARARGANAATELSRVSVISRSRGRRSALVGSGNRRARLAWGQRLHVLVQLQRRIRPRVDVLREGPESIQEEGDRVTARSDVKALQCAIEIAYAAGVVAVDVNLRILRCDFRADAGLWIDAIRVRVSIRVRSPRPPEGVVEERPLDDDSGRDHHCVARHGTG